MSTISQHIIDEVRLASDVVAVVADYVTLKKSGRNFFGLCPFHPEKSPSFSVNQEKQIFHCFGCGAGGNVFTFIQRQQGVSFPEAVRLLAKRAGIAIPEPEAEDASAAQEKDALYFVNKLAAEFFQAMLLSDAGRAGRDYMQQRGFNEEALRAFGVGYAPQAWDSLVQQAEKKSVNLEVMALAGLINRRDAGSARGAGYYDRFRHRVMFPIYNPSGSVVAFGGRRIVADEDSPKYMNSPETPIYHKGTMLYGLYQGRDAVKAADRVIVVEGYLDLMRMHLCGFQNAIATSGTALTQQQARLILRYTKNVTLLFDSDTAGQSATLRGADILVENGLAVSVAALSAGDDPDSFLVKHPAEAMQQILRAAPPLLEFKILNGAGANAKTNDPVSQRTEQLRSIVETAAKVRDGLERQALVHNIAERLHVDEATLIEEINRLHRLNYPSTKLRQRKSGGHEAISTKISSAPLRALTAAAAEEYLITMMILYNDAIRFVFNFMRADDFAGPNMRVIASALYELFEKERLPGDDSHAERATLLHHFNDPWQAEFVSRCLHAGKFSGKNQDLEEETPAFQFEYRRVCADCMAKLLRKRKEEEIQSLQEQLKEREKIGEDASALVQQIMAYQDQRKSIQAEKFLES